ncbi:hypothetical protein AB5I41_01155 [Sphingomonas sp. MMS24-JH45]
MRERIRGGGRRRRDPLQRGGDAVDGVGHGGGYKEGKYHNRNGEPR